MENLFYIYNSISANEGFFIKDRLRVIVFVTAKKLAVDDKFPNFDSAIKGFYGLSPSLLVLPKDSLDLLTFSRDVISIVKDSLLSRLKPSSSFLSLVEANLLRREFEFTIDKA